MASGESYRPMLIFCQSRENRFSLPILLGCIEEEGLTKQWEVLLCKSSQEILRRARRGEGIIAFSFMTPKLLQIQKEIQSLRAALDNRWVFIAGGSHPSADPVGTLRLGFDFVFVGEAEKTFPDFLRRFLAGKLPASAILEGERDSSRFVHYPPYFLQQNFFAPLEITRGCPYNCAYCQTPRIFGHKLRHRTASNAAQHLRQSLAHGYRQHRFLSPNAFSYGAVGIQPPDATSLEELFTACRAAGSGGLHFGCYPSEVRPEWVKPDVLQLVKKYCRNRTLVLGAQSGSDEILERVRRGHTVGQARQAVRFIREAGFKPHVDFVFGFPGEKEEDRKLSLRLIEEMILNWGANIHAHTFLPLPGTPLFSQTPSRLDADTKNALKHWEQKKRLDGWWDEQEDLAWKIVGWRDEEWMEKMP
jgi:B12-binding domain/radical SAM domain protein